MDPRDDSQSYCRSSTHWWNQNDYIVRWQHNVANSGSVHVSSHIPFIFVSSILPISLQKFESLENPIWASDKLSSQGRVEDETNEVCFLLDKLGISDDEVRKFYVCNPSRLEELAHQASLRTTISLEKLSHTDYPDMFDPKTIHAAMILRQMRVGPAHSKVYDVDVIRGAALLDQLGRSPDIH